MLYDQDTHTQIDFLKIFDFVCGVPVKLAYFNVSSSFSKNNETRYQVINQVLKLIIFVL